MSNDNYISNYSGSQIDNIIGLFNGKGLNQVTGLVQRNADGTFSQGSGGGGSDVFVATYGTTTYSDLSAAINANKVIIIVYSGTYRLALHSWFSGYSIYMDTFMFKDGTELGHYIYTVNDQNVWSRIGDYNDFQYELISGTNIKTINNTSLLGSGNITVGGEDNVQSDWNQNDNTADDYIKNKPTIPDVFVVTPNVTTYNELTAAIQSGKYMCIHDNDTAVNELSWIYFAEIDGEIDIHYTRGASYKHYKINSSNVWTTAAYSYFLTGDSTLSASKLSGTIPSTVTATTQTAGDNSTKIATTAYVDGAISSLPDPMVFKGSLGTGGTITTLPTAAAANKGFTYKVIEDGTYASQAAKVGDTFISDGSAWILIPSGDEPSGTVTSVGIQSASNNTISVIGSPITSSGTIELGLKLGYTTSGNNRAVQADENGNLYVTQGAIGATNWLDGSATGSVRTSGSGEESVTYTIGLYATSEGRGSKAFGNFSHAEGYDTQAKNSASHAEGSDTLASGTSSHAEGDSTTASGACAHSEGFASVASGSCSHASGDYVKAAGNNSSVYGKFNIEDSTAYTKTTDTTIDTNKTYYILNNRKFDKVSSPSTSDLSSYYEHTPNNAQLAFIIGNGVVNNRSNAFTVDWDGNVDIPTGAKYKINGTALSASDVGAQPTLISGTNIKTINNESLLGNGNINITAGVSDVTVSGNSIVTSGVAAIPVGTASTLGVVKVTKGNGLSISEAGSDKGTISMGKASSSVPGAVLPDTSNGLTYNASSGILSTNATSAPIANTIAKFDSSAHINSEDMTSQEVEDFVDDVIGELTTDSKFAGISSSELYDLETTLGITHAQASRLYNIFNKLISPEFTRYVGFDSKTVQSGTASYTKIGTITVPAGTGVLQGSVSFPQNATGHRRVVITIDGTTPALTRNGSATVNAVNGAATVVQVMCFYEISASTTFALYAMQNSGTSLSVNGAFGAAQTGWVGN